MRRLISLQFPQWAALPVHAIQPGGSDNRSFRLGEDLLVRLPSDEAYAAQVRKEQHWLPRLAAMLSLPIPEPIAMGEPTAGYPFSWSIYRWLNGESASASSIADHSEFARQLAQFLLALQSCDASAGPPSGPHNFHRGGSLAHYDHEVRRAMDLLGSVIDTPAVTAVWQSALASPWAGQPTWVHGDISPGNLLVRNGQLAAVIDFGQLGVGDPACDLTIAWTFLQGRSRRTFRDVVKLDDATWARARAWALWKGLIVAAGLSPTHAIEWSRPLRVVDEVLADA